MKNKIILKKKYDQIYENDQKLFFSKYVNGKDISETNQIVLDNLPSLEGKVVVDLGCGDGELIYQIAKLGAKKAIGIDYSEPAIELANNSFQGPNLRYECCNLDDSKEKVDIVITNGTLEHLDEPGEILRKLQLTLNAGGLIYVTCPHFYNLRGFIWITLNKLLEVPMSLTDLHNITPSDMEKWSIEANLKLIKQMSYDYSRANGERMILDMKKRLTNALSDAKLPTDKINSLLDFCENFFEYQKKYPNDLSLEGMSKLYILQNQKI